MTGDAGMTDDAGMMQWRKIGVKMCVAYPGEVKAIDGRTAKVDFGGNVVDVNIGVVYVSVGQYVLVHAGCAIEAMSKEKATEIIEVFQEIGAL
jgi:hydrogenase expression/formation protein HypC